MYSSHHIANLFVRCFECLIRLHPLPSRAIRRRYVKNNLEARFEKFAHATPETYFCDWVAMTLSYAWTEFKGGTRGMSSPLFVAEIHSIY